MAMYNRLFVENHQKSWLGTVVLSPYEIRYRKHQLQSAEKKKDKESATTVKVLLICTKLIWYIKWWPLFSKIKVKPLKENPQLMHYTFEWNVRNTKMLFKLEFLSILFLWILCQIRILTTTYLDQNNFFLWTTFLSNAFFWYPNWTCRSWWASLDHLFYTSGIHLHSNELMASCRDRETHQYLLALM